ncbi:MAG: dihydroorotate dehydrogenase electron transfer subunit [Desulfovibrionaceae bacterium]|nr:dihydroorotate dehydrogenase electron transfer subunit [Desulfovibrionaceae bacterium]
MSQPASSLLTVLDLVPFGQSNGLDTQFFALRLERPSWTAWKPGQFMMVRPTSFGLDLPWGRPFGICHMTAQHLICFFQVVGRGTQRMAALKSGDKVQVWGPLGNGFAMEDKPTLLLAGGMGIVPFIGYVHEHHQPWNLTMLFGHRQPLNCYPVDSINERITVDSLRESAVGDLDNLIFSLRERMADVGEQNGLVLACGPLPFLKTVQQFALELKVRTQLSLENKMACGVGACLGCVCQSTENYPVAAKRNWPVQVCTHGPVFWADQISLD